MKIHNIGRFIFTIALILFVLLLIISSFSYPKNQRMIPLIISVFTFICLISTTILDLSPKTQSEASIKEEEQPWAKVFIIMAWMALFFMVIFFFGFITAIFSFCLFYLVIQAKLSWSKAIIFTLIVAFSIYGFFILGLNVTLWPGLIPEIVPNILGGGELPQL